MLSTCGPDSVSWSSIALCVLSVLSSRFRGFMSATASSCKRKVNAQRYHFLISLGFEVGINNFLLLILCHVFLGNVSVSPVQQQIHKMLGDVLNGINCVRLAVVTPYFYTVGEY